MFPFDNRVENPNTFCLGFGVVFPQLDGLILLSTLFQDPDTGIISYTCIQVSSSSIYVTVHNKLNSHGVGAPSNKFSGLKFSFEVRLSTNIRTPPHINSEYETAYTTLFLYFSKSLYVNNSLTLIFFIIIN